MYFVIIFGVHYDTEDFHCLTKIFERIKTIARLRLFRRVMQAKPSKNDLLNLLGTKYNIINAFFSL